MYFVVDFSFFYHSFYSSFFLYSILAFGGIEWVTFSCIFFGRHTLNIPILLLPSSSFVSIALPSLVLLGWIDWIWVNL